METIPGIEALPDPRVRSPVVTWGVFDGVHVGHRKVLDTVAGLARRKGVSSVAVTFDRHPEEVVSGRSVPLLTTLRERLRLIGEIGVDFCVVLGFTRELSGMDAGEFIRTVVAGKLRASGVVLGHDSRFGRGRGGDIGTLIGLARDLGMDVCGCDPVLLDGRPVSSSLIRELLAEGRLDEARRMLGRPPSITGAVVAGRRRGSGLGFPTANLELRGRCVLRRGVYVVEALLDGAAYRGVANVGVRPTFRSEGEDMLEVHMLGYGGGDLYGRTLEVRFLARMRDEKTFEDAETLRGQIERDIAAARGLKRLT